MLLSCHRKKAVRPLVCRARKQQTPARTLLTAYAG